MGFFFIMQYKVIDVLNQIQYHICQNSSFKSFKKIYRIVF